MLHVCYMKFGIITINIIIIVVSFGFGKRSVTGARTTLRAINTGRFMQAELLTAPPPSRYGEIHTGFIQNELADESGVSGFMQVVGLR